MSVLREKHVILPTWFVWDYTNSCRAYSFLPSGELLSFSCNCYCYKLCNTLLSFKIVIFQNVLLYFFMCLCVYVPSEARREHQISWSWSYRCQYRSSHVVQESKLRSSGKEASTQPRAISPTQLLELK